MPQFLVSIRLAGLRGKFHPLAGPPTLPAGWVAQLRWRRGVCGRSAWRGRNERREERGVVVGVLGAGWREGPAGRRAGGGGLGDKPGRREMVHTQASTVRDQMTRASAHNNCLFTLRSYPIPGLANPSASVRRSRIEDRRRGGLDRRPSRLVRRDRNTSNCPRRKGTIVRDASRLGDSRRTTFDFVPGDFEARELRSS